MLILFCAVQKILFPINDFRFLFNRRNYNALFLPCPLCPTSWRPTKSNLYLASSLAAALNEPALYRSLTFQVPNLMSFFRCLGRTRISVQVRGVLCKRFETGYLFVMRCCQPLAQTPRWSTTPCWLSTTAFSIYSQLPSTLEAVPPSATWGRAMPWWQEPTYHGLICLLLRLIWISLTVSTSHILGGFTEGQTAQIIDRCPTVNYCSKQSLRQHNGAS